VFKKIIPRYEHYEISFFGQVHFARAREYEIITQQMNNLVIMLLERELENTATDSN
jgi:hypothetical protein